MANKVGRPTKYSEDYCRQAKEFCLLGATDEQLARFLEVSVDTIYEWKKVYPKFSEAIKVGKDVADAKVAKSLYERACGYSHKQDKIFSNNGEPMIVETTKHYPPDATSMIFWLKNRQKANWRDKQDYEVTGKGGGPIAHRQYIIDAVEPA